MPQFLYRIEPVRLGMLTDGPTAHEASILDQHFRYLEALVARGIVLMAGRTLNADEHAFGIVVLVAASAVEAAGILRDDPAVAHGIMKGELFPYRVALWSAAGPTGAAEGA